MRRDFQGGQVIRRIMGGVGEACREALWSRPWPWVWVLAALGGFLGSWLIAGAFPAQASRSLGVSPGALAGTLFFPLAALGLSLALFPSQGPTPGRRWIALKAWWRGSAFAWAAMLGAAFSPGNGLTWKVTLTFMALAAAQTAFLCALAGLAGACVGPSGKVGALAGLLFLSLATTALFWSKEPIQELYKRHPGQGEMALQTVLAFCPLAAWGGLWYEEKARFDLFKENLCYDLWLGSSPPVPYPRLWPSMETPAQGWTLGLIPALLLWGLAGILLAEWIQTALSRPREASSNRSTLPVLHP